MADPSGLHEVSNLLELVYRRNKNQHRVTNWWRQLSMLRRCVARLEHVDLKAAQVRTRMHHMQTTVIPRCYRAFTQLVADTQFSPVGLVLVSTLAVLQSIVRSLLRKVGLHPEDTAQDFSLVTLGPGVAPPEDLGKCVNRLLLATGTPGLLDNAKAEDEVAVRHQVRDDSQHCPSSMDDSLKLIRGFRVATSCQDTPRPSRDMGKRKGKGRDAIDKLFNALN
ncbi:MAG: hypothetical protein Q9187_000464 [Circinaria calcarea]